VAPLEALDHWLPFQRRIVPFEPTAQTSLDPLPQTALSPVTTGVGTPGVVEHDHMLPGVHES